MASQIALCTWCRAMWPVESAAEADEWLRTHPCPQTRFDDAVAALERIADALGSIAIAFDRQHEDVME